MRPRRLFQILSLGTPIPFLFGRAFIEAGTAAAESTPAPKFPFLLGGAFIEAACWNTKQRPHSISLPFREGFH